MARNGPNRTAFYARRAWDMMASEPASSMAHAEEIAERIKSEHPYWIVRVRPYRYGPNRKPMTGWNVYAYRKPEEER